MVEDLNDLLVLGSRHRVDFSLRWGQLSDCPVDNTCLEAVFSDCWKEGRLYWTPGTRDMEPPLLSLILLPSICVCLFTTNRCVDQWRCLGRKSFIISWHFTRLFTTIILIIIMSIFRVIDSWSNRPGGFTVIWSLSNRSLCLFCQRSVAVDTSETTSWCSVFHGTRCSFFFCSGQSQCETQWSPYMNMIHSLKWQQRAETGAERESSVRVKGLTALTFKHVL